MMTPGTVVGGKYSLSRLLGQGAMGEVWAAVNEATGGEVALKLLSRPGQEMRHRLLREARACGRLRHRNVIDVHDVGVAEDGEPFLVMERLAGETLAGLLERKRRLAPHRAARIARDVARALEAAHKLGIVHRDMKPANVFLHREDGAEDVVVKVLDFGASKSAEASDALATVAGMAVGSPAYMSPEQARAAADLDHRTDIWSLGVVLFEMLTGKRPFDGDARQLVERVAAAPAPRVTDLVRDVDPGLAALVGCCLEREPARRFGSAGELAAALDRYVRPPLPFARPPQRTLMDGDDLPTTKWDRGIVASLPRAAEETPVDPVGPTLPDPQELPLRLSRTLRLSCQDAAAFLSVTGSLVSSTAPLEHRSSAPAGPRAGWSLRPRLAAALGLGALTLVLSGASLFRVLGGASPARPIPPEAARAVESLPLAAPASGETAGPREEPIPSPSASASALELRPAPKAARSSRREDGGKPPTGAPAWLKKAIGPGR
jgi:serine/threonine protein kinase